MRDAAIEQRQVQSGRQAELLRAMSDAAFALIKVIELERSGIRDGDGMGGAVDELIATINAWIPPRGGKPAWRFELTPPWRSQ
jgi:hypothetical protein